MPNVASFAHIVGLTDQARDAFRASSSPKADEVEVVFGLFVDLLSGVGAVTPAVEITATRLQASIGILSQAMETVFAMYSLSESGFWDNALALKRNFSELLLTAIAVGYDERCFIDWKHDRGNMASFDKVYRRAESSHCVPALEKELLPLLKRYWIESSHRFSHNVKRASVRTMPRDGSISLEPNTVTPNIPGMRLATLRNMMLNVVSVLAGVSDFPRRAYESRESFPIGESLIDRINACSQDEAWKTEPTI